MRTDILICFVHINISSEQKRGEQVLASQNKPVYFNVATEKDYLDFAESVNFSAWVKERIKEAMNTQQLEKQADKIVWNVPKGRG